MFIPKVISFNFLNKKELGKTKKLQAIVLQRKTPENKLQEI